MNPPNLEARPQTAMPTAVAHKDRSAGLVVFGILTILLGCLAGLLVYVLIAVIMGYAGWSSYHLEERGWWLILGVMCLFMVSSLTTYARHDTLEVYRLMGYPEAMIQQIQKSGMFDGHGMMWLSVIPMLPFLGFILFVKKFLPRKT